MASDRNRWIIVGGVAAAVIVVLGASAVWYLFIRDDAPEAASTEAAVESAEQEQGTGDSTSTTGGDSGGEADTIEGTWTVDTTVGSFDDFTSTWAGYRIDEELAGFGANTAAGRTPDVSGDLVVDGTEVTTVSVEVDMTTLVSDDERRDGQMTGRGLQTDTFPTATFGSTAPIDFGELPADGETVPFTAEGDLTLHGVTQTVMVDLEATLVGDLVTVVGSTDVPLGRLRHRAADRILGRIGRRCRGAGVSTLLQSLRRLRLLADRFADSATERPDDHGDPDPAEQYEGRCRVVVRLDRRVVRP